MKINPEPAKQIDPEILAGHGLLTVTPDGKYACPNCGNGNGEDATGCSMEYVDGAYLLHCFRCNQTFDAIHIARMKLNLSFKDAVNFLNNIGGVPTMAKKSVKTREEEIRPANYLEVVAAKIERDAKNLDNCPYFDNGFYRGISLDTFKKFNVGYCTLNKPGNYNQVWENSWLREDGFPRMIFPSHDNQSFLARYLGKGAPYKNFKDKPHYGQEGIFGFEQIRNLVVAPTPTFIVEGEFDALSLVEKGFNAIALGGQPSTQDAKKLVNSKAYKWTLLKSLPKTQKYIMFPDNDPKANVKNDVLNNFNRCAVQLQKLGINIVCVDNPEKYLGSKKDVNDLLRDAPQDFSSIVGGIITDCEEKFKSLAEISPEQIDVEDDGEDDGEELKKTVKRQKKFYKDFIPDAPTELLMPPGYAVGKHGIYDSKGKLITSTPVIISHVYQTPQGSERELQLMARVCGRWIKLRNTIPQTICASPSKLAVALSREGISIAGGGRDRKLAEFITDLLFCDDNLDKIPTTTLYTQPGWTPDLSTFIYPTPNDNYIVKHKNIDYAEMFAECGDVEIWKRTFVKVLRTSHVARLFLGAAMAAPALKITGVRNLQYHLNALSGQGKSALVKFAMSLYGNPQRLRQVFNATSTALDLFPAAFNDLPLWIDELQSAPAKLLDNINTFVYNYENGETKFKLNKDSEFVEQFKFRGVRITTGEMSMLPESTGQGAMRRLLDLSVTHCLPEDLAKTLHQECERNFGHFGKAWTAYLADHKSYIIKQYETFKATYSVADYLMGDYLDAMALAHASLLTFCKMLGIEEMLNVEELCKTDFVELAKILPSKDYSRNSVRALQYLDDMVHIHAKNFIIQKENERKELYFDFSFRPTEHWGYMFKDGSIAIFPTVLKTYLTEHGFPSADPILKDLHARGIITANGGIKGGHRYMRRVKISDDKWDWVIWLNPGAFAEKEASNEVKKSSDVKDAPKLVKDVHFADYVFEDDPEGRYYEAMQDAADYESSLEGEAVSDEELPPFDEEEPDLPF